MGVVAVAEVEAAGAVMVEAKAVVEVEAVGWVVAGCEGGLLVRVGHPLEVEGRAARAAMVAKVTGERAVGSLRSVCGHGTHASTSSMHTLPPVPCRGTMPWHVSSTSCLCMRVGVGWALHTHDGGRV